MNIQKYGYPFQGDANENDRYSFRYPLFLSTKKTFKEAFLSSKLFCSQDFIERENNGNGITTITTTTRIHKKKIKSTNPNFIQLLILVNKYIF